ncbi:MAG TPA: hypothetical protein VEL79_07150, partial [Vicinamibacterales bacterium]|nr:hypothetical protein [Vicinamibacterales bacterium]
MALPDGRTLILGGVAADGSPTDSAAILDPVSKSVGQAGRMLEPRVGHTATALKDGRVLIAGGVVNGLVSADIEIFDPVAGASVLAGSMSQARTRHAAALVGDASVLIAGGVTADGVVLDQAEIVDAVTGGSTPLSSPMLTARAGASATTLLEGHVLIAGGENASGDLNTAELFEPWTGTFIATDTQLSVARSGHSAVLLPHNAGVLIAGGTSAGAAVATSDLFLPAIFPDPYSFGMGAFAPTGALAMARTGAVGGPAGDDGHAFVAGGGTTEAEQYSYATIKSDKNDYAPGEQAVLTGSGWQPGETLTLRFQEDPAVHPDYVLTVTADTEGNIYWDQWSPEQHDLSVRFYLMASDSRSRAQTTFTDSSVTITAPTGGQNIPADRAANAASPQFTSIGDIKITESSATDFGIGSGKTLVLGAPAGWAFNPGVGTVDASPNNGDISGGSNKPTIAVTSSSITVTLSVIATTRIDTLTISGIQVRAANGANIPGSGDIFATGGTAAIAGVLPIPASNPLSFARLSQAPGAVSKLITTLPGQTFTDGSTVAASGVSGTPVGQTAGTVFAIPSITAADQFFNVVTSYAGAKTLSYSGPTAPASYTTAVSFTNGVSTTALNTTLNKAETTSITVSDGAASGPASSSFVVGVGPLASFKVTNTSDANIATQTAGTAFDIKVTALDAGGNIVTGFGGGNNKVLITSTGTLSAGGGTTGGFTNGVLSPYTVNFSDSGAFTITATKNPNGPETGTSNAFLVNAPACTATAVTTQPANQTVTFGAASASFAVAASGTPSPTVQWQVSTNGGSSWSDLSGQTSTTLAISNPTVSLSGNQYRAVFTNTCNGTKTATSSAATLTVNPATTTTAAVNAIATYSAISQTVALSASVTSGAGAVNEGTVTFTIKDGSTTIGSAATSGTVSAGAASVTYTLPAGTTAKSYTIQAVYNQATGGNFATSTDATHTLTVGKASQTIAITQNAPASAAYNTSFDVKATGGGSSNAVTFAPVSGSVCTVGTVTSASGTFTAPVTMTSGTGTCRVALNQTGDANYSAATQVLSATTTAAKASQTIAWSNPSGITYGTALSTTQLNASLTTGDGALTYSPAAGTVLNAGNGQTLRVDAAATSNYNAASKTVTIDVAKATPVVTVSFASSPIIYDGNPHAASASVTLANPDEDGTVAITYTPAGTPTNAGSYTASAHFTSSNPNFNSASSTTDATLTINKADATVSVDGYTGVYDGNPHGATGSAKGVGGVVLSGLTLGASFTDYPGGTAHWSFADTTGNYNNQTGDAAIVINKADANVTVNGYTGTYDGAPHGATGTALGVGGANLAAGLNLGATFTDYPGGTAHWTFAGGTNYNNQNGNAAIVLNKATANVTVHGYSGPYDGSAHGATGTATGVGSVDLASGLNLGATFSDVPGGTAHWTFTGGTNYSDQTGDAAIVINKADANVTVNGYTGTYDGAPHGAT